MTDVPGKILAIDSSIAQYYQRLAISSRSHPLRLFSLLGLAMMRFERHIFSGQSEDLDKSILHFAESIFLPPRLWSKHGPLILKSLFFLACALLKRSQLSQQYKDAIFAANYLRYLLNLPFNAPRHLVMTMLVEALDVQIKLEAGNVMQNIEEMTLLCRELLTSDVPDVVTTRPVILLVGVVGSKVHPWVPDLPLNQLIECLRLATLHKPELRIARSALAVCLSTRYFMTFVNGDYEEASSILDEITTSRSPGDGQDEFVALIQLLVTGIAVLRSETHHTPEYSEEAIYRTRTFLAENPSNSFFNHSLEDIAKKRFNFFGFVEDLKASSSDTRPVPVPSVAEEGYRDPELGRLRAKVEQVEGLLSGIGKNEITKIDEAIENGRSILASSPPHLFSLLLSDAFAGVFLGAFKRTNKIEYLNESISTLREALDRPYAQHLRFTVLGHLSLALFTRYVSLPGHCAQDVDEALELLSRCANDGHASLHDRFQFACRRASLARGLRHACISVAYEDAMSLTQDILLFAPTLQLQHTTLVTGTTSDHPRTRSMPLDYASYQIELGELEEAIMTLERGRALLWSEMRYLRASIDQLLLADLQLGRKFAANSRDLEELTKSKPPSHKLSMDDVAADSDDLRAVDPFGRLLVKQRQLLKERDDLISQIRVLPGFDSFLASPSFDVLRSAASSGPIIIINHSAFRSDILILLHNTSPSLVATPADFYQRANALKNKLLDARNKYGPSSSQYDETLAEVLKELYDLVGKPVIDRLRELNVPEQSRVWWCPTSVFCSLPLHAMGPIPSDDSDDERYFLDLYIPSYTPTLSALIHESDPREPTTSNLPSLLLVSHFDVPSPDVPLSDVCEDIKIVQGLRTRLPIKSLISEHATPSSVLTNLQNHQFVHFICHGTLEPKKPFDAGFELHSNARLTLLEIVRHSLLPSAEFAFLAACHTAELTDGSSADEGLHLAAAAQYCGFKSVVGTMWAMANVDGADLAKWFYRSVFARKERGEAEAGCYYRRSAGALREAVRKLRKKRGITLERWVNFVHYGA